MNIYITQAPPPVAILLWDNIAPLLEKALDHAQGEFDLGHLREMIYKGAMIPVLIFNDMELVAAAAVEKVRYPAKHVMRVALLGGEGMDDWLTHLIQYLDSMALAWDVSNIELSGRRGWLRALDVHGYEATYTILSKTVEKPGEQS